MARVRVGPEPFDVGAETARLLGAGAGGIASFLGVVRDRPEGGLLALELEHYPGMTERACREIAARAETRFGLAECTIIHRVGRLGVGEPIVLVLAAAAHRREALDAASYLIDWLKTSAPFWKREILADGGARWVEAREGDVAAAEAWEAA